MKVLALGLQTSTTTSYDQTKTTFQGRTGSRTTTDGNGPKTTIGPNPVQFGDVFDDTGAAPSATMTGTSNGRIFVSKGWVAGILTISYYTMNLSTGALAWQGDLKFTFTNTGTYTMRGFKVDDTSSASMMFSWATTNTTAVQGGFYACYGVNITDFAKVSIQTFPVATAGSTNKTIYQIGDTVSQAAQTLTAANGVGVDSTNHFAYFLDSVAATPKIFKFDITNSPTATPSAGYTQANGTIVVTATLPALTGAILLTNNIQVFTPTAQPSPNNTNNASLCMGWITSTNIYWTKVSDITNGATTLPSLLTATMTGSTDYTTPTASFGEYSGKLDKWVIGTSLGATLIKQGISNDANAKFVSSAGAYIKTEIGSNITPADFNLVTTVSLVMMSGWAMLVSTGAGQRGFLAIDLSSDESSVDATTGQIFSSIISPVLTGNFTQGTMMGIYYELSKRSVKATVQYRTSNFSHGPDSTFDATWTTVPKDGDLSGLVNATQAQFRFLFTIMGLEVVSSPQINEAYFVYTDGNEMSSHWNGSVDNTTANGASPARTAFRLQYAYATSVPTLYFRAYDDNNNLVASANTAANPTFFEYTTNNGSSWNALGTIPNTPLTTEVRYNWTSPPGVRVIASIRES